MQVLNPAETFGDIIVDYSYVECSSACITALAAMRKRYPDHRRPEVDHALQRGKDYILSIQLPDGSWCDNIYSRHAAGFLMVLVWKGGSFSSTSLTQTECAHRYGSWGVCFTYGTWFGIEALAAMGESIHNSEVISPSSISHKLSWRLNTSNFL